MVFIDDCSTDGSFECLQDITKTYENVRILKNDQNSGISYTRNRLIDQAQGEYLWFIDSDDMLYPHAASALLKVAEEYGIRFAGPNCAGLLNTHADMYA